MSASRPAGRPVRGLAAAWLACAACASPAPPRRAALPPAGSARDRETGILARLSAGRPVSSVRRRAEPAPSARRAPGGSPYADYRFDPPGVSYTPPEPYEDGYTPVTLAEVGSIEGTVVWPRPPSVPSDPCAGAPAGPGGAVAGAVVHLEGVTSGRFLLGRRSSPHVAPSRHMQVGGVLEWRGCRFHPSVQVVAPIGSVLGLVAADEPVDLVASWVDGAARSGRWEARLGAAGGVQERALDRAGLLEISGRARGRSASAWVVVAGNPYHVLTDALGRFVLDEVPPGTYTLVVWRAPLVVGRSPDGSAITRPVPSVRRRVIVEARKVRRLVVHLPTLPR